MDAIIEDALVEWYETERLARAAGAEARRGEVIDLDTLRYRQNPALMRLFGVIEQTVASLSLIQPVVATDRGSSTPRLASEACVHA